VPVKSIRLAQSEDIRRYAKRGWLYRGQSSARWPLQTSLERACDRQRVRSSRRSFIEDALFREFRRAYHQYSKHIPQDRAVVEWLSLMQHHGAPTRLLDFSYSLYVAAYFAIEAAEDDSAVWAVNGPWAGQQSAALLKAAGKGDTSRLLEQMVEADEELVRGFFLTKPAVATA
jgi:hypothetical protein